MLNGGKVVGHRTPKMLQTCPSQTASSRIELKDRSSLPTRKRYRRSSPKYSSRWEFARTRMLADVPPRHRSGGPRPEWLGGFCPCYHHLICCPRLQRCSATTSPSTVQVPDRHQARSVWKASRRRRARDHAKNTDVDRRPLSADGAVKSQVSGILRAEEFRFWYFACRDGCAGDADRHRHSPEMSYKPDATMSGVGRVHHAMSPAVVHPLRAFDRRIGVLHRRLPACSGAAHGSYRKAARAAVDRRCLFTSRSWRRRFSATRCRGDTVLGRAGHRQSAFDCSDHRRRPGYVDSR